MAKSQGAICGTARIVPSLWLYNNLLPLNVRLVLRKTPVSIYILVLYIYKQFKSGLAAPPLGEVTCYSVYILTLSFIFFSFIYNLQNYPTSRMNWISIEFHTLSVIFLLTPWVGFKEIFLFVLNFWSQYKYICFFENLPR